VRRICLLVAIVMTLGHSFRSAGLPALSAGGTAAIDRMFQAAVDKGEIPGASVAVTNRDRIVYLKAFGKQDVANGIPMSTDTLFRIASMTKPVTSVGVMMLYDQGKLKLDDAAGDYVPAMKGREVIATFNKGDGSYTTRAAASPVTIRQLLTHTSGLAYSFTNETALALQRKGIGNLDMPLLFDPGTRWNYSPATATLGAIVEKFGGASLEDFDQTAIFRPLGMVDTSYLLPADKARRLVTVHQREATGRVESPNATPYVPGMRGDGGLISTATDYSAFLQMLLNEGRWHNTRLLRPESVRLMTSNQIGSLAVERMPAVLPRTSDAFPAGAGMDKFGLGFQISTTDGTPVHERASGSFTWAGINNTHFWVDPKNGIGVVMMTQVLPFYNPVSMDVMKRFERLIYENLSKE
jgi:CubicO group peptidase (beta-lactamase class C family)